MSENTDLQRMHKYICLADKLQDRIDNPKNRETVAEIGHTLKMMILDYANLQKKEQEVQMRIDEFYKRFATKEEAEEQLRKGTKTYHPIFEPYIASASAVLFGFYACIAACFSRETSKAFLRKKDFYSTLSKKSAKLIKLDKETKQLQDATLRQASKNEFAEAKFIDDLRKKFTVSDETAYEIAKQPELLAYAILESMKEKYAPDL